MGVTTRQKGRIPARLVEYIAGFGPAPAESAEIPDTQPPMDTCQARCRAMRAHSPTHDSSAPDGPPVRTVYEVRLRDYAEDRAYIAMILRSGNRDPLARFRNVDTTRNWPASSSSSLQDVLGGRGIAWRTRIGRGMSPEPSGPVISGGSLFAS